MVGLQTLRTQYRVSDFLSWQRDRSLQLNPDFQRRSVWKKGAKSYLIDTILKGFPIPIIFLRDMRSDLRTLKSKRDVVDGQQRIRTILSFIDPELVDEFDPERDAFVIDKTHNPRLGGKKFDDLEPEDKRSILDYQFSVHSFPADTDDRLILQIFARMNATGYKLNEQELRNADFYGEFKTLVYELSTEQLNRWREWRIFNSDQIARMSEVELSSEFMMLITHGIMDKKAKGINDFYRKYDSAFPHGPETARRFRGMFDTIEALFGKGTIADLFKTRGLFYALFATIYGIQYGLRAPIRISDTAPPLPRGKATPIGQDIAEHIEAAAKAIKAGNVPPEVLKAARGATTDASQRALIIGYLAGKDNDPCPRAL